MDEPTDSDDESAELLHPVSEESNDPILQVNTGAMSMSFPRTPSAGMNTLNQESTFEVSNPSSSLRDRIPALDQSIASVREAAALPSTTPSLVITPCRIRTSVRPSSDSISRDENNVQHITVGNESRSSGSGMDKARQSTFSTTELRDETTHDAFEFSNFHAEFSEVFGDASQNLRVSSTQRYSVPRYSRSPHLPAWNQTQRQQCKDSKDIRLACWERLL